MQDPTIFYVLLFLHLVSIVVGFGAVIVIDAFGALWLLKKTPLSQVIKTAEITQKLIWIGWTGTLLSGIPLIFIKGAVNDLTVIKIFLVLLAGSNGIFLHYIKKALKNMPDNLPIPGIWLFRMFFASGISQISWWGALLIGFLNRQLDSSVSINLNATNTITLLIGIFALTAVIGEWLLVKRQNVRQCNPPHTNNERSAYTSSKVSNHAL